MNIISILFLAALLLAAPLLAFLYFCFLEYRTLKRQKQLWNEYRANHRTTVSFADQQFTIHKEEPNVKYR